MFGMNTNSALRDGVVGVSLKGGGGDYKAANVEKVVALYGIWDGSHL